MDTQEYDDPDVEERWCESQRASVADYLRSQKVKHGRIGEWPAWHIWAIESLIRPESIGWWVNLLIEWTEDHSILQDE